MRKCQKSPESRKDRGRAPQTPQSPTLNQTSIYFINYLPLNISGPKHYAHDSMLRASIPLHHRDVSAYVRWIRTFSCSSRVHVNHSRRFLNLHASHIPERSPTSSGEQIRNKGDNEKGHDRHVSLQQIKTNDSSSDRWELTVGIEIHAQLNTERKLFSSMHTNLLPWYYLCSPSSIEGARTSLDDEPNSHVSVFDLAFPGSQPVKLNSAVFSGCAKKMQRFFKELHLCPRFGLL